MLLSNSVFFIYGVLLFAGAFIGFKAGSKVSLWMGLVSSAAVFASLYLLNTRADNIGLLLMTFISGLLSMVFLIRLIKTKKIMPSGMLFILSSAVFGISLFQF